MNNKGITLISILITLIVTSIIATVTVDITGNYISYKKAVVSVKSLPGIAQAEQIYYNKNNAYSNNIISLVSDNELAPGVAANNYFGFPYSISTTAGGALITTDIPIGYKNVVTTVPGTFDIMSVNGGRDEEVGYLVGSTSQLQALGSNKVNKLINGGSSSCPAGYTWNGSECISCPAGYTLSGNSCYKYITTYSTSCPSGYTQSGSQCIEYVTTGSTSCPAGYTQSGSQCVAYVSSVTTGCPSGYTWNSYYGECLAPGAAPVCPNGGNGVVQPSGAVYCESNPNPICPPGYNIDWSAGYCVSASVIPTCPQGYIYWGGGNCIDPFNLTPCPSLSYYNQCQSQGCSINNWCQVQWNSYFTSVDPSSDGLALGGYYPAHAQATMSGAFAPVLSCPAGDMQSGVDCIYVGYYSNTAPASFFCSSGTLINGQCVSTTPSSSSSGYTIEYASPISTSSTTTQTASPITTASQNISYTSLITNGGSCPVGDTQYGDICCPPGYIFQGGECVKYIIGYNPDIFIKGVN